MASRRSKREFIHRVDREMSGGGKISSTKLSFTLPISCQICLEKVKEPVTCPNQHVFCSLCMEVWLERNKQCPTCRVDITPQSPIRKIIGGVPQSQSQEIRSPRTTKHMRRARMELLFRDYEDEISELQREVACLKHSNDDLRTKLSEEEQKNSAGVNIKTKKKCSRCGNMQDLDSMLEMAKNLQEATKTFEHMKEENIQLRKTNEKLVKDYDDLKRQNTSVKEELLTRSPMKFGRLTVATLESRIEAYEKQIAQLNKALEKSDTFTESLQEKLRTCSCSAFQGKQQSETEVVTLKDIGNEPTDSTINPSFVYLSGHDYTGTDLNISDFQCPPTGTDVTDSAETYTIENILPDDLVSQAFNVTLNKNSVDQSLFLSQLENTKSPFTPSTKFSRLNLGTPQNMQSIISEETNITKVQIENLPSIPENTSQEIQQQQQHLPIREHDSRVRSFTAHTMPPVESPDYKEKLEQIQDNLLHPITRSSSSPAPGQIHSFSRKLTFDDNMLTGSRGETFDLKLLEENTGSSCGDEIMMMLHNEDSIQSVEHERDSSRSHDELRFLRPQSVLRNDDNLLFGSNELNEMSSNPILSSGHYQSDQNIHKKQVPSLRREVSSSVIEAGSSRITTTKLSQSDRDIFTRPSSAPSRTFLLSGSRFSALRPIDPIGAQDSGELSQFQPVKCKSPSPLSLRKLQPSPQKRNSNVTPKKEAIRCVVDGRAASPMLQLVSPDDVMGTNWKQTTCHARSISVSSDTSAHYHGNQKTKDAISRIAILKRNNSGKPLSFSASFDLPKSPTIPPSSLQVDDSATTSSTSRRSSRKQCLNDPSTKRVGDHSLEFTSPIKSPKMESKWNWNR
uniref:uncharacterized protein LOC120340467 n=1 Tax=Styela clava TaxID=7725 RepID=UPI00193A76B9|nr:uncharacterized protein LOC120340467 [Styela clava]